MANGLHRDTGVLNSGRLRAERGTRPRPRPLLPDPDVMLRHFR